MMQHHTAPLTLGAIDVGTNAARMKLAHLYPDGRLVPFLKRRAPIRPGEGVFERGEMAPAVAERLVQTLRAFADDGERHGAQVRAVATSSLRNARNAKEVRRRVRKEAGVALDVISGMEEARLICRGVADGVPTGKPQLVLDIGGGSTEVMFSVPGEPMALWSLPLGTVRLGAQFDTARRTAPDELEALRGHVRRVLAMGLADFPAQAVPPRAFGTSGAIRALVDYVGPRRAREASRGQLGPAVDELAAMKLAQRRKRIAAGRADIIVAGGVILECLARQLGLEVVETVDLGLRDGLLRELADAVQLEGPGPRGAVAEA